MELPTKEASESAQRRAPEEPTKRQSAPELDRDEPGSTQMGEDPGTLEPDEDR